MRDLGLLIVVLLTAAWYAPAQQVEPQPLTSQVTTGVTAQQDSAFKRALALQVTARIRFADALRQTMTYMETVSSLAPEPTVWERAMANLAMITPDIAAPTTDEVMAHRLNLQAATYVPGVLLYPMGSGNLQIGLGTIGRFIGIVEDVSPHLVYALQSPSEVRIAIYSTSAIQVRMLYKGLQRTGSYSVDWNGKDDSGREVVAGDYVAEISIGQELVIRKRIVWPAEN